MSNNIHETPERIDAERADRQKIAADAAEQPADQPPPAPPRRTVTNRYALPQALYEAMAAHHRPHDPNVLHVTELVQPPRIQILQQRHEGEIIEDAMDRFWAFRGTAMHEVIAAMPPKPDRHTELSVSLNHSGILVTGTIDLIDGDTLSDWKFGSVFGVIFDPDGKPEHRAQVNLYRYLLAMSPILPKVQRLQLIYLMNDWSERRALQGGNYPSKPVVVIEVPMWDNDTAAQYLDERVALYMNCRLVTDDELPLCSDKERWRTPTTYAVMKEGRKSALKLHDNRQDAESMAAINGNKCYVEIRNGEDRRCAKYCSAAPFCDYGRIVLSKQGGQEDESE